MRRTRSVGNGAENAAVNEHGQSYGHALRPPRAPGRHQHAPRALGGGQGRGAAVEHRLQIRAQRDGVRHELGPPCRHRAREMPAAAVADDRHPAARPRVEGDDAPLHALERPLRAVGVERRSRRPPAGTRSAAASRRARRACGRRRRSRGPARRRGRRRAVCRARARPGRPSSAPPRAIHRVSPTWSPHQRPVGTGSVMPPARRCPAPSRSPCGRGCRAAWARARARRSARSSQAM